MPVPARPGPGEGVGHQQAQPGVALGLLVADTARKPWEITVLAVAPAVRGLGLGRALIHYAQAQAGQAGLCAETDADAAGFYGRCGFSIVSLGENIPTYRAIAAC